MNNHKYSIEDVQGYTGWTPETQRKKRKSFGINIEKQRIPKEERPPIYSGNKKSELIFYYTREQFIKMLIESGWHFIEDINAWTPRKPVDVQ